MDVIAYKNAASFALGTGIGFSIANSIKLMDDSGKMPESHGYEDYQPMAAGVAATGLDDYAGVMSGESMPEALSNDPGFVAGTAFGVYLSHRTFEMLSMDPGYEKLEETYRQNDLDDTWEDVQNDMEKMQDDLYF